MEELPHSLVGRSPLPLFTPPFLKETSVDQNVAGEGRELPGMSTFRPGCLSAALTPSSSGGTGGTEVGTHTHPRALVVRAPWGL